MDVAGALRAARKAADLSQKGLGRRAGVSASAVNRYESGRVLPSLVMLDRLLAACGKDLRLVLVERVDDLAAEFGRRAALPLSRRGDRDDWLRAAFLERLVRHGVDVLVAGGWAADLHGVPHERSPGRLLLPDDPEVRARAARAFMAGSVPWRVVDGQPASLPVRPETFGAGVVRWVARDVGRFTTEVVPAAGPWPAEQRLPTPAGPLRVVAAAELGLDDGVEPQVLAAWQAWRQAAGHEPAPWTAPQDPPPA